MITAPDGRIKGHGVAWEQAPFSRLKGRWATVLACPFHGLTPHDGSARVWQPGTGDQECALGSATFTAIENAAITVTARHGMSEDLVLLARSVNAMLWLDLMGHRSR